MKGYWRLALAAGAAYLLFLLITVPAERVVTLLVQHTPELNLQSVRGTVLSGGAQRMVLYGLAVGPLDWSLRPWLLLTGRLEYRVELRDAVFHGAGAVGTSLGGQIYLHDLQVTMQPGPLVSHFSPLPVQTAGDMKLQIDSLELIDGFPVELAGRVDWDGARIIDPLALSLGHVAATLTSEANRLVCRVNGQGDTAVSGDFSLTQDGDYRLNLLLTPGPNVSADIVDTLKTFGQPRPGGAYLLNDSGHL